MLRTPTQPMTHAPTFEASWTRQSERQWCPADVRGPPSPRYQRSKHVDSQLPDRLADWLSECLAGWLDGWQTIWLSG